jgi:hypothetical protein
MLVRRFYDDRLAQAAYLIGCQRTGDAMVIDPPRNITPLLEAARAEGLRITMVSETHIHADFVSGARELSAATGAKLYLSAEGGPDWQYGYATEAGALLVRDGDEIILGGVKLTVRHTPGHTPEHIVFIVTDTARSEEPLVGPTCWKRPPRSWARWRREPVTSIALCGTPTTSPTTCRSGPATEPAAHAARPWGRCLPRPSATNDVPTGRSA